MSVTFIDPPGNIPQIEPLDFTTTQPVLAVSVEYYGQRAWDVVYQDGRFSPNFQTSTFDGTTWTIRPPNGRWPWPPRLIVDEEPVPSTPVVTNYGVIYEVDLSAQANQTLTAGGAHTIDGKTWYAKGSLSQGGATYTRNLVNGSGLSLAKTAAFVGTIIGSNADLDYPHWFMPLSQISGYNANVPLLVRARFVWGTPGDPTALVGLCSSTDDSVGLRAATRAKDYFVGPSPTAGTTAVLAMKRAAAGLDSSGSGEAGIIANVECVVGVLSGFISGWDLPGSEHRAAAGMPTDETTFRPGRANGGLSAISEIGARSNPGVFFGVNSGTGGNFAVYLQRLQLLQPEAV